MSSLSTEVAEKKNHGFTSADSILMNTKGLETYQRPVQAHAMYQQQLVMTLLWRWASLRRHDPVNYQ